MQKFRYSVVFLVVWLLAMNGVERLHHPLNLARFVYLLTGGLAVLIVCLRHVRKIRMAEITVGSLVIFAVTKWLLGYQLLGASLPLTVTEVAIVVITNLLAWRVGQGIDEFEQYASDVVAMQLGRTPVAFESAEGQMYNEVQRARRFERVLSLATVSVRATSDVTNVERLMREVRHELVRKYLESRLAKLLLSATSPTDLVAYRDGQFILMFPEVYGDKARELLEQVASDAQEQFGLRLRIGVAEFPEEECTLAGLIERAEAEVRTEDGMEARPELLAAVSTS